MGKKSLYAGIILISISIFSTLGIAGAAPPPEIILVITLLLFVFPWLIGGIILIVKYFRSRKKEERFSISQNNQDNSKKYEPKTNDETQFWVCPVCGKDTKELDGKSYCDNCQRYL